MHTKLRFSANHEILNLSWIHCLLTKRAIIQNYSDFLQIILSQFWVTIDRVLDWRLDLLTTYTYDSEPHAITVPPPTSTIHKSPQHPLSLFPACCVFSRSLATASNSTDSSTSHAQVLFSQPPGLSKLLYDGRFTANQFVLVSSPLRPMTRAFFSKWTFAVIVLM
jgi:hypothetical protein